MKHKLAFIFPGQGSQYVGMAKDLMALGDEYEVLFDRASDVLKRDIKEIAVSGPEGELSRTQNTQPAIFITNRIAELCLRREGMEPSIVAGHSLGEYNALLSAGVFDFETALGLIAERSLIMERTAAESPGKMVAVIGLDAKTVQETILNLSNEGVIGIANYNSPAQVIVSGESGLIALSLQKLKAAGAKRLIELEVSGAFHSKLMATAAKEFSKKIDSVNFAEPKCAVVSNLTGRASRSADELKKALIGQMDSSVRWVDSVLEMEAEGVHTFIELGPKKVLCGLVSKILPGATTLNVEDSESLKATISAIKEAK
ncbi:MAG: ACP S-malonyltransferase [Actinomycetota bacterium]|nr:ACP S-malonyltransferase [Actinomycetota bacterium]